MAQCWYYDVSELAEPRAYRAGLEQLPWDGRRRQVERYVFEKDRLLCLGAGLLCAQALRYAGVTDLTLAYGENGKPYLAHVPDVHFNLSHSGHMAVCAVSGSPIGVDVEELREPDDDVMRLCFQDREIRWLQEQENRSFAFTRLWTRKESYLKYLGTGFSKQANSCAVLPEDEATLGVSFHERVIDGHALCVCAETRQGDRSLVWSHARDRRALSLSGDQTSDLSPCLVSHRVSGGPCDDAR